MPGYLSNIATRVSFALGPKPWLAPMIRSRSPIAERDQRLGLTEADWAFEGIIESDNSPSSPHPTSAGLPPAAGEALTAAPPDEGTVDRGPAALTLAAPRPPAAGRIAPPISGNLKRRRPDAGEFGLKSGLCEGQTPSTGTADAETRGGPAPGPASAFMPRGSGGAVVQPRSAATGTAERDEPANRVIHPDADVHVGQRTETARARQNRRAVVAGETAGAPSLPVTTVPRQPSHPLEELPRLESGTPPASRQPGPAAREPIQPTGAPGVFIGRIDVEVIPPPAEKAAAKPNPASNPRSGVVSQIGPLEGAARQLAFAVRYQ